MRQWRGCAGFVALGLLGMSSCGGREVGDRVRRLEERVSALEGAAAPGAPAPAAREATADVLALERRLAALERQVAAATAGGEGALASGPPPVAATRLEQRRERRARLREVAEQYRARLAAIRQSEADPAARQQAVREALEWYREQRRAVLAGEEPPNQ